MKIVDLILHMQDMARSHGKRVFTLRDLCNLSGEARIPTAMTLTRAARRGILARAGNLWINLLDPPELIDLALALESPSYLSFESALYRHGILSQSPRGALTMATTRRSCVHDTPLGSIRYFHLDRALFYGYDEARIALPAKALLDLAYHRGLPGRGKEGAISEEIDLGMLSRASIERMSRGFPGWVLRTCPSTPKQDSPSLLDDFPPDPSRTGRPRRASRAAARRPKAPSSTAPRTRTRPTRS